MLKRLACLSLFLLLVMPVAHADDATYWYQTKNVNDKQSSAQTNTVLWTPTTGSRIILQGCAISSDATQTTKVLLNTTVVIPVQYSGASTGVVITNGGAPIAVGDINEILKYTTTTTANTSIVCVGYEKGV